LRRVAFNWTRRGNSRHKGSETTVLEARYRVTEIQSMERLLAEARAKPPRADAT
jgi:hypothetical protein